MSGEDRVCRYPCDCGQFPDEHCACMDGHASPPAATASTGAAVEALAEDIYYWLIAEGYYGHYPSAEEPARRLAEQTLASDWLAAHDAATAERVRRETAEGIHAEYDGYLPSEALSPAWIAGWHAATRHHAARIAREQAR